jgi:hypothetical protein
MAQRFRPRELQKDSDLEDVRRQLNQLQVEIGRDLDTLFAARKQSEVITATTYAAAFGEVARFAPPSGGTRLILPEPNPSALDSRVTAVVEAASGPLSVEVVNGTINGATTLTYATGIGTAEFILTATGWYGWSVSLVASLPLTALASQAADTFLGNFTASSASPTARAGTSVAGTGLTYTSGGTLSVSIPLTDGDKGDIVVASSGTAWTIDSLAVTTGKVAANAVTNAKLAQMSARSVKLRADSAGTGDPTDGTGAQVGEILRWGTVATDAASTGTVTTYTIAGKTNVVRFTSGITALTLRGATIPAETGQIVVWENNDDTGVNVTFNNEDASAAAAGNRFRCPGGANLTIAAGNRVLSCYINQRWRVIR